MAENPTSDQLDIYARDLPAQLDGHSFQIRTHPSVPRDRAYLIPNIPGIPDLDLDPGPDLTSWHQMLADLQRTRPATVAVVHISELQEGTTVG